MPLQIDHSVQLSWKHATRPITIAVLALASLLCAPLAAHAARITLAWNASTGTVSGYRIYYGTDPSSLASSVDVGNQTSYPVDGLTTGVRYYFEVRAYNAEGVLSSASNRVDGLAPSLPFTDTLSQGLTPIRAIHIAEMRLRINTLRSASGLQPIVWTDAVLTAGVTIVKATHISEMRTALNQVYTARQRSLPGYTDQNLTAGSSPIRTAHIADLRNAITALE